MLALTMLKEGAPIAHIAADRHVSKRVISALKQAARGLPDNTTPTRKAGTGTKKKTTDGTHAVWPRYMMLNPSITTANLKKKQPMSLQDTSIRIIQHRPQKDLNLPLLTSPIMKRMLQFCYDYLHWTSADWKTIKISCESSLRLVRRGSKLCRRPPGSSRYDSKYIESVLVWGAFIGKNSKWGLLFLPKNIAFAGANYLEVLEQHMLSIWDIHQCRHFIHDGAPAHMSKFVKRLLEDREIPCWQWPGNSPYLNLIENAWYRMKNNAQEKQPTSITDLTYGSI